MSENVRIISINIMPPKGQVPEGSFIKKVQSELENFLSSTKYQAFQEFIKAGTISFSWYDDFPVSYMISLGVNFSVIEGVDLVKDLVISFRKAGYEVIGVTVGY